MAKRTTTAPRTMHECELTINPQARAAADTLAASVKSTFPAGLSQPALRALAAAGYTRLDQLTRATEREITELHGMGPQGIRILCEALAAKRQGFKRA